MRRKKVLQLNDTALDTKIKIQGTQFDRKRKLTDKDWKKVRRLLKKHHTYKEIAAIFNVSPKTIRYGVDETYRRRCIEWSSGKHTGVDKCTFEDRVNYKRYLVKKRKIKVRTV